MDTGQYYWILPVLLDTGQYYWILPVLLARLETAQNCSLTIVVLAHTSISVKVKVWRSIVEGFEVLLKYCWSIVEVLLKGLSESKSTNLQVYCVIKHWLLAKSFTTITTRTDNNNNIFSELFMIAFLTLNALYIYTCLILQIVSLSGKSWS